ncbi:hypothetical protein OA92_23700 [Marinomonas sp. SBI22]|nr:hypothetical protein OA92_23700 [Marinomonas sp. SBI22]KZM38542.1 hypothetical protein OA91_23700 [Marinomonas sp. SBI8L]
MTPSRFLFQVQKWLFIRHAMHHIADASVRGPLYRLQHYLAGIKKPDLLCSLDLCISIQFILQISKMLIKFARFSTINIYDTARFIIV